MQEQRIAQHQIHTRVRLHLLFVDRILVSRHARTAYVREHGHVEILNLPVAKVKVSDREKAPVERYARRLDAGDCGTGLGARIASGKGYK